MADRPRGFTVLAATTAVATLSACAASTEVQQAVAQRHAEEAARPAAVPPAAAQPGGTSIDVVPNSSTGTASTQTSANAAPSTEVGATNR